MRDYGLNLVQVRLAWAQIDHDIVISFRLNKNRHPFKKPFFLHSPRALDSSRCRPCARISSERDGKEEGVLAEEQKDVAITPWGRGRAVSTSRYFFSLPI